MLANIYKKLFNGDKRTALLKKNIAGSLAIKGWGCLVQFLLVPITLNCLNQYEYGIWLTINSILVWIDTFDIGLGNGLRNLLAEAIANNDYSAAKKLTSTTFLMLLLIIVPVTMLVFLIVNILDIYSFLNIDQAIVPNLREILMVSFAFVGSTFVLKFIGNIYLALQLPAINNTLVVGGQTLALIGIFIMSKIANGDIFFVAVIYTLSPLAIYFLSYPITFKIYKELRPSFSAFDKSKLTPLFSLGIRFFLLQIGALILFATSNILISKIFSPSEVTPYQIAFRYFGLVNILFTIMSAPLWSATTNAYVERDINWIIRSDKKMKKLIVAFSLILALMVAVSPIFYNLWIGDKVAIPLSLSIVMAVYMFTAIYGTCYSNFICGIGKINLLTTITIIEAVAYIPLAILCCKALGIAGIVVALIIVNSVSCVINRRQFKLLVSGSATGIWNK